MDVKQLTGSVKVAIVTNAIGAMASQAIFERMSEDERKLIKRLQSKLVGIPSELEERVVKEFLKKSGATSQIPIPEIPQIEESPETAETKKKISHIQNLEAVQDIEAEQLYQLIRDEHPQTIALILVHLNPNVASDVLSSLPDSVKSDVAVRIASLDKVLSGMVEEIDRVFEQILKNKDHATTQQAGGVARLADILNAIDGGTAEQIIDEIEEDDPDLADEIKQMMFVFDDIVLVDDKGLQKVLRSVESNELAVALKASTEEVKQKIFRNMSDRASEILKEEIEVSGAVRMKDVTDAQQKVTRIIQEMERKGELIISGRGGEEYV
ncbi:MAG: flagellar motor switch protein FliG [Desulfobacteraceae bacterium]|nr:flagellar motor switch protein FliG [Desulfobacteraceae bacterium]